MDAKEELKRASKNTSVLSHITNQTYEGWINLGSANLALKGQVEMTLAFLIVIKSSTSDFSISSRVVANRDKKLVLP